MSLLPNGGTGVKFRDVTKSLAISIAVHIIAVVLLLWAAGRLAERLPPPTRAIVSVDIVSPAFVHPKSPQPAVSTPTKSGEANQTRKAAPRTSALPARKTDTGPIKLPQHPVPVMPGGLLSPNTGKGDEVTIIAVIGNGGDSGSFGRITAGAGTGGGGPGSADEGGEGKDYTAAYSEIRALVEKTARRSYPPKARRLGMEGTVVVKFSIGKSGVPEGEHIVTGSGLEPLDEAALEIIKNAGPYPYVPEQVWIPIRFSLDRR
jgi:TonB family protein